MSAHEEEKKSGVGAAFMLPTVLSSAVAASPRAEKCIRGYPLVWLLYLCAFELGYLLLFVLSAFPGLHLYSTPIAVAWSWTLLPSRVLVPLFGSLVSTSPSREWFSPLLLGITFVMLIGTYACAIVSALRLKDDDGSELKQSRHRYLALFLGGAFLFSLTLLLQPKLFSDDIFTSIFSGRILTVYHVDPLNTAPMQFPSDPYLGWVIAGRNTPNIFGPLWLCLSSVLVGLGGGPVETVLLFKCVAILSHLLSCVVVWSILGKLAPSRRVLGTLLYAWNPLAVIELAGSGHGEGVLMLLLLCATWLSLREARWSQVGTLIVLGLAISTNLITLLIVPLYIWFGVRTVRSLSRAFWICSWRMLLVLIPALLIWLPFWRGATTFFAVTSAIDMEHFVHSPVGTLAGPIRVLFQFVANSLHLPSFLHPIPSADITLRASAAFIFALIYIDLFGQVRRAPRTVGGMRYRPGADVQMIVPGFDVLLRSWGMALFWYLVLVSGWFWPWYMLWMLWAVILRRFDAFTSAVLLLSATALFLYPLLGLPRIPSYQSALIFGIPLVYLFLVRRREKQLERIVPTL
jgi:hypothetical protein